MDKLIVNWTCPHCGVPNLDDYINTAVPLCGGCERDVEWSEIFNAKQLGALNIIAYGGEEVNVIKEVEATATVANIQEYGPEAEAKMAAHEWSVKTYFLGLDPKLRG